MLNRGKVRGREEKKGEGREGKGRGRGKEDAKRQGRKRERGWEGKRKRGMKRRGEEDRSFGKPLKTAIFTKFSHNHANITDVGNFGGSYTHTPGIIRAKFGRHE